MEHPIRTYDQISDSLAIAFAVVISDHYVFINETKSNPDHKDIEKFAAMAGELPNYIPEAGDRPVILIFSALDLSEDLVAHLTRCGIYAMEMKGETMDLTNFDAIRSEC